MVGKYYIKTFGCQANIADSSTMAGILEVLGYERYIPSFDKAVDKDQDFVGSREIYEILQNTDIFIINTCSVRQKSEDKVYGIGKTVLRFYEEEKRKPIIIMAGCMVGSALGERKRYDFSELKKKTPWVDFYISPADISNLPNILNVSANLKEANPIVDFYANNKQGNDQYVYVNISSGCDNFCTFCVVPYSRGREVSRSKEEVIREVSHLIKRGYGRIMLCGQNVNSWGLSIEDKMKIRTGQSFHTPFVDLLKEVHDIEGLRELAFISSNPFDFTKELIDVLKLPKISRYIHIAVQSGNDEILKKMNRRHSVKDFIELVRQIRQAVPEMEIGTDIIVGFPGESEEQFMDTVKLVKEVKFKNIYISMYSPRKGTAAQRIYKDDVSLEEKKRRHAYLTKVWRETLGNN